jgi:ribonuclease HI
MTEYEALLNGLRIAAELGVQWFYNCGDSEIIVNQVMGESSCHDSCVVAYWQKVRRLEEKYDGFELYHILQQDNEAADALARFRWSREPPPSGMFT